MATPKTQALIDFNHIYETIMQGVVNGLNQVGENANQRALHDVPVRKVFRYGRRRDGTRFAARQDVRPLGVGEREGRRGQPGLTTLFPGNYRTINRANDARSIKRRQTGIFQEFHREGPGIGQQKSRAVRHLVNDEGEIDYEAESDLSARGRYELKKGRAVQGAEDHLGGALHDSITPTFATLGPRPKFILRAGGEKAPYARYVEFGTRHARAQPFLRPALAQAREELLSTVVEHIRLATTRR